MPTEGAPTLRTQGSGTGALTLPHRETGAQAEPPANFASFRYTPQLVTQCDLLSVVCPYYPHLTGQERVWQDVAADHATIAMER